LVDFLAFSTRINVFSGDAVEGVPKLSILISPYYRLKRTISWKKVAYFQLSKPKVNSKQSDEMSKTKNWGEIVGFSTAFT